MRMTIVTRFRLNAERYDRFTVSNEKRDKYAHLHKKMKHQSKIFRKKYEIEHSLELKEKEAMERCNVFQNKYDDECFTLFEEIEYLEQKLKAVQKRLHNKRT